MAADYDKFKSRGAEVLAVSIDPPAKSRDMAAKLGLPFPLLSDPDHKVIESFQALESNMARPSTFVVNTGGVIPGSSLGEARPDPQSNAPTLPTPGEFKNHRCPPKGTSIFS